MVRRIIIIAMLFMLSVSILPAQGDGVYSPFAIGFGARQLGMGGATVAGFGSSSSLFWNPAGLQSVNSSEIQLFHMNLFMDTRYSGFALAYPTVSAGVFAIGIGDLASGDFQRVEDYNVIGTYNTSQDLFAAGYGFSVFNSLAAGITIKGVYYNLADYKDTGFGFDFGLIYKLNFVEGLKAGLRVGDIYGPRIRLNVDEQRYPLTIRGGLSYGRTFSQNSSLSINADFENVENAGTDIYAGGEFGFKQVLFGRLGYKRDKLTVGAGIAYSKFSFDYAYMGMNDLETSHRLSFSFAFGDPVDRKRAKRNQNIAAEGIEEFKQVQIEQNRQNIETELANAAEAESSGDNYGAIESYYKVLALDGQNQEASQKIASLFEKIKLDISSEASRDFIESMIANQLKIANDHYDGGRYDQAAAQYNLMLILDPGNETAKSRLQQIENRESENIDNLKVQARREVNNGNYEQALGAINRILTVKPDDAEALRLQQTVLNQIKAGNYLNTALQMFESTDYEGASAYIDSVLSINPDSEGARTLRNRIERLTAEETTLEDIKSNAAHWEIYIQGMEKYQSGEYDEAVSLWQALIRYYPNNPNLNRNIEQAKDRSNK